jgi:hypothetical protein
MEVEPETDHKKKKGDADAGKEVNLISAPNNG